MMLGFLKHKILDSFNKNEPAIVSGIADNINKKEITELYSNNLVKLIKETMRNYDKIVQGFKLTEMEILDSIFKFMKKEISLRAETIKQALDLGLRGKELWRNLKPKYLTEFEIISPELGLKGRVDRVKFSDSILPYEIKTRDEIYEDDKLQLAAYSLLLEQEFGRKIDKGVVETQTQKEEVNLTEKLKTKVLQLADKIRNLDKEPEFQSNFNKCRKCRLRKECFEL